MPRRDAALARSRLDAQVAEARPLVGRRPPRGWIRAIRDALGMTATELGTRMGVSQARVSALEVAERDGRTTLTSLEDAADALDCDLVYALVPRRSLDDLVRDRATAKAREILGDVTTTMRLEDQEADPSVTEQQLRQVIDDLVDQRGLWS